jgi:hypothetical protein
METHMLNLMLVKDIMEQSPDDEVVERLALALTSRDREIQRLRTVNTDLEWQTNPDRMGGQFTQEEIDRSARGGEGW